MGVTKSAEARKYIEDGRFYCIIRGKKVTIRMFGTNGFPSSWEDVIELDKKSVRTLWKVIEAVLEEME